MSAIVNQALSMTFEEALPFLLEKTGVPADVWQALEGNARARSFTIAGAESQAFVDDVLEALQKALKEGTSLGDFTKQFGDLVKRYGWQHTGKVGNRARIIYQTNLSMAHSAGRYAQMTTPEALLAFPVWQYVHSGAKHPRLDHKSWDGLCLSAKDPVWQTIWPPNGWGCGCWVRPMTLREMRATGRTEADKAPETSGREEPDFNFNAAAAWLEGAP